MPVLLFLLGLTIIGFNFINSQPDAPVKFASQELLDSFGTNKITSLEDQLKLLRQEQAEATRNAVRDIQTSINYLIGSLFIAGAFVMNSSERLGKSIRKQSAGQSYRNKSPD